MSGSYPELLSAAWHDHIAPRDPEAPTVISTFAGCGGSSLGYSMAGFRELLAVEWDENSVETFRLNFPDVPVFHGDINSLSVEEVLARTGLRPGELDVFDGSPPCQGFSTAGKRNLNDSRNDLFLQYVRLLEGLQPRAFVMENVSGMVKGKMRLRFVEILTALRACGYQVSARLMNAEFFNVPQKRLRLIFIGTRNDLGVKPSHPAPLSWSPTVRQAIGHLPLGEPGKHEPETINAWKRSKPGQSLRKAIHYVGSFQSCRLDPDRPSPTQVASSFHWHYAIPRKLNAREAAILMSFPPEFTFAGAKSLVAKRIGNAVAPMFMRAIAGHIRSELLEMEAVTK
jgi:DNA (cytosine-5)-methyltransferase 1